MRRILHWSRVRRMVGIRVYCWRHCSLRVHHHRYRDLCLDDLRSIGQEEGPEEDAVTGRRHDGIASKLLLRCSYHAVR